MSGASLGLAVVNLGTPQSPAVSDVRAYLREFLSDRAVVDLPRALWWPILYGAILPFRAPRSAELYQSIWTSAGSPLLVNSRAIASGLAERLGPSWSVRLAMRYGEPRLERVLAEFAELGCAEVVLLPLFPQYSGSTTGSIVSAAHRAQRALRSKFRLSCVAPWYAEHSYIQSLARGIRASAAGRRIDHHVFSFHGLPVRYVERGDPYRDQCARTAELLAQELGLDTDGWSLAFQSRFGREPWLEPAVELLVPALATRCPTVLVATPGFAADCLETLEEIAIRLVDTFRRAGGSELLVAPCLNADPDWLAALALLVTNSADSRETSSGTARGT